MQYSQFKALNFSKSLILLFKFKSSLQTSEFLNHTYTNEVDVKVKTDYNHTVTISRNKDLKLIIAVIKGDVVSYTLIL